MDPQRRPGRPLRAATSEAILSATARILAEGGYTRLTIERVAQNARVSRASINRRWASKLELVVDLLRNLSATPEVPDTGRLETDLAAHFENAVAGVPTAGGRIMPALIAESFGNREFATILHDVYLIPRRERATAIFERALERGELRAEIAPAIVADMISGFIWQRRFVSGLDLDAALAGCFIATLIGGLRPPA